jgi:arsenate reductase
MKVLVVCTGNSCRSQIAEAWFNERDGVEAKSAGTHPETVNRNAVAAMSEVGIDIGHKDSNHLDDYIDEEFDYVITVCDHAEQHCPVFAGAGQHMHHSFEDPAKFKGTEEETLNKFRAIRDEIQVYVNDFVKRNM